MLKAVTQVDVNVLMTGGFDQAVANATLESIIYLTVRVSSSYT